MIIWNDLKVQTSTNNIITISPNSGTITGLKSLNVDGRITATTFSGNINGGGTFNGQLSSATGSIGNSTNSVSGYFSGTLVNAAGSLNNITLNGTTTLNNVNFTVSVNLPANSTINNKPILDMLSDSVYQEGYLIIICTKSGSDKIHITNLCNTKKIDTLTIQLSTKSGTTTYVNDITLNVGEPGEVKTSNPILSADDVVQMSINNTNVRLYDIGACPSIQVVHPEYYNQIKIGFYVDPNNTNRNNRYVYLPQTALRGLVFGNMIYSIPHFLTDYRTYSYICRDDQWVSSDDTVDILPVVDCINPNAVN